MTIPEGYSAPSVEPAPSGPRRWPYVVAGAVALVLAVAVAVVVVIRPWQPVAEPAPGSSPSMPTVAPAPTGPPEPNVPVSRIPIECGAGITTALVDDVMGVATTGPTTDRFPSDWIDAAWAQAGGKSCWWEGPAGERFSISILAVAADSPVRETRYGDYAQEDYQDAYGGTAYRTDTLGETSTIACSVYSAVEYCDFTVLDGDYWMQGYSNREQGASGREPAQVTASVEAALTRLLGALDTAGAPGPEWVSNVPRELALTADCEALDPQGAITAALPDSKPGVFGGVPTDAFAYSDMLAWGIVGSPFCYAYPESETGYGGVSFFGTPFAKWAWPDIRKSAVGEGWVPAVVAGADDALTSCENTDGTAWRCSYRVLAGDGTIELSADSGRSQANAQKYSLAAIEAWLAAYRTTG